MIVEESPQPLSLAQILSTRAQHASAVRLAVDIAGGAAVAAAAIVTRPKGWVALMAAALCFLSYGTWAATGRRLHNSTRPVGETEDATDDATDAVRDDALPLMPASTPRVQSYPLWLLLHTASALGGLAAFLLLLFATLALSLGKIIS